MSVQRTVSIWNRLKLMSNLYGNKLSESVNRITHFETPEKLKGTFLERWGRYWKILLIDYRDVTVDVAKNCKERPIRAFTYFSSGCYYLSKHNPDETLYREQVLQNSLKLMQVGETTRNPVSVQHLKWIEQCYNEGLVHRLNLGIMSLIWLDNYESVCALYKTTCPYLKPRYITFYRRIVDVGFLDKWWLLDNKMVDYDVNEMEFQHLNIFAESNALQT